MLAALQLAMNAAAESVVAVPAVGRAVQLD